MDDCTAGRRYERRCEQGEDGLTACGWLEAQLLRLFRLPVGTGVILIIIAEKRSAD